MSVEVELKKSKADLLAEFRSKQTKHYLYGNADPQDRYIPNYFYFYVPEHMGEYTVEVVKERAPWAGVAVQCDGDLLNGRNTVVAKAPKQLHDGKPGNPFLRTAIMRMSSELCGKHAVIDEVLKELGRIQDIGAAAALRQAGTLDCEDLPGDRIRRAAELAEAIEGLKLDGAPEDQQQKWLQAADRFLEIQRKELSFEALIL
jgi:hypothetical protein